MTVIKFQADADLNQAIVSGVLYKQPSIDFKTTNEAKLEGIKDPEVLAFSAKQQRVLVTHDRRTMPTEFGLFIENHQSAGVVIVSKRLGFTAVIDELIFIWQSFDANRWKNRIVELPLRNSTA